MSLNIVKSIKDSMRRNRSDVNESEAGQKALRDKFQALGLNELGQYQTGKLSAPQEANLKSYEDTMNSTAGDFSKKAQAAGYKGNALEADLQDQVKMDSLIMRESMKNRTLQKALQSLGYSLEETKTLLKEHQEERQQEIDTFTGLMKSIGSATMLFAIA